MVNGPHLPKSKLEVPGANLIVQLIYHNEPVAAIMEAAAASKPTINRYRHNLKLYGTHTNPNPQMHGPYAQLNDTMMNALIKEFLAVLVRRRETEVSPWRFPLMKSPLNHN